MLYRLYRLCMTTLHKLQKTPPFGKYRFVMSAGGRDVSRLQQLGSR
jgi:hypothetical protein